MNFKRKICARNDKIKRVYVLLLMYNRPCNGFGSHLDE